MAQGARRRSFAEEIMARLQRGAASLSYDARDRLRQRVEELRAPSGGFRGLDGQRDLYFSGFGFELAAVLNIPPRREDIEQIETLRAVEDDGIHLLSVLRCRRALACSPCTLPGTEAALASWCHSAAATTYGAFLIWLASDLAAAEPAHDAAGWPPMVETTAARPARLATTLGAVLATAWRLGDNATAADCARRLAALRHPAGGWRTAEDLAHADLLATAVAAFALDVSGFRPSDGIERDLEFVLAHRCADGGFAQRPGDGISDVESSWYALLALGSLRDERAEGVK